MRRPITSVPKWRIRAAGQGDVDALALVGAATFLESFAGILDGAALLNHCQNQHAAAAFAAYLAKGAQAWLVEVEPGHAAVGYALLTPPELDAARDGDIELKRIYLLSRFHGMGMAQALMDTVQQVAAQDHTRLLLGVKDDNHRALSFYRRQGFARIGKRQFNVGGLMYQDLVLARPLTLPSAS